LLVLFLSAKWAQAVSDQDVLRIIEDRVTMLYPVRAVELDESMGWVRFTLPDVIAVNTVSVARAFVFQLRATDCFLRHSVPLLPRS
jgi:hypothetical protein